MKKKIMKSFQGRILLISMIGIMACILSCCTISYITIRTVGRNKVEESMNLNMDSHLEHLEFCYLTMVRMMQQMGEAGNIGTILQDYLNTENNFEEYLLKQKLVDEMVSIGFMNLYINFAGYVDSETKVELFGNNLLNGETIASYPGVKQIGDNRFQAIHRSTSRYNSDIVVSMLRENQTFNDQNFDIYIEMKTNIPDFNEENRDGSFLFLQLSGEGEVLFCNGGPFEQGDVLHFPLDQDGTFSGIYEGYFWVVKATDMDCIFANGVPDSEYQKDIAEWYERILILCVVSVIPALLIVLAIRRMLGQPMKRLENEMIEIGKGKLELVNEDMEIDEFHDLMHEVNEMKIHIKELLERVQTEEQQRQKTEREKLMYQINPHFLLNTLNSVQWMAQLNKQEDISRFVADFKSILAYNLGKEEKVSTLRAEVMIARKYIHLQKQRYDFDAVLEVEEGDYLDTETIRMLLQPMIENSLRYGLGEVGRVEITIFYKESLNYAVITIQDYGNGLTRKKLEEINRPFQFNVRGTEENLGIGLRYVRHCLEGFYNGKAILTVNSELGKGTKITVLIPVHREDELDDQSTDCG